MRGNLLIIKPSPARNYANQLGCSFFRLLDSMNPDNLFEGVVTLDIGEKEEIITEGNIKIICVKERPPILRTLFKLWKLVEIVKKEKISAMKATDLSWASFLGVFVKFITGKPLLVCVNNPLYLRRKYRVTKKFANFLEYLYERVSLRYADMVKVIASPLREELITTYKINPKKIVIISACSIDNGIDIERFRERKEEEIVKLKEEFGLGDNDKVILCIARFAAQKNLFVLLKAFKLLVDEGLKVKLLLLGDGSARPDIEDFVQNAGLTDLVIMPGFMSNDILPSIYHLSDVFVLPSLFEGLGTVLIEAMASGIPVVTSDIPYTKDVVTCNQNALCFQVNSPLDLKIKLIEALSNQELREVLVKNAQESIEKFGIAAIVKIEREVYKKLLSGKIA